MYEYIFEKLKIKAEKYKILPAYNGINLLIKGKNEKFILKINPSEEFMLIQEETKLLDFLKNCNFGFKTPFPCKLSNSLIKEIEFNNKLFLIRKFNFIEGVQLTHLNTNNLNLKSLSQNIIELNKALNNFNSSFYKKRNHIWKLDNTGTLRNNLSQIKTHKFYNDLNKIIDEYEFNVLSNKDKLRKSFIHGDLNDRNIIFSKNNNVGIIDFGDFCHSFLIDEIAILFTYLLMVKKCNFKSIKPIFDDFNSFFNFNDFEVNSLYYSILLRVAMCIINSEIAKIQSPENTYRQITLKPALDFFVGWKELSQNYFINMIKSS